MDAPTSIELGFSPAWFFGWFFLAVLFFHWWLVYRWRLGEVAWKRIDYIWLAFGLLAIFGETTSLRQHWFEGAQRLYGYRSEAALDTLKRDADTATSSAICRIFVPSESSPPNVPTIQAEYDYACKAFKELTVEIRTSARSRDAGFLAFIDGTIEEIRKHLKQPELIIQLSTLQADHRRFTEALGLRSYAKGQTETTIDESMLTFFSPYLLLIAVALRVTKVTGEIRLKTANGPA